MFPADSALPSDGATAPQPAAATPPSPGAPADGGQPAPAAGQNPSRPAAGGPPAPPSLSLPKGGGAIRDIGEKFTVSAATGTASLTIPVTTSPGRAGFGPSLSLDYDSGAGNSPFGLGWKLELPVVTRKTDKGLPRYADDPDSDTFILSGAEDLVPVRTERDGVWRETPERRAVGGREYLVQQYRPRIEGLFARIERWHDLDSAETHWRTISSANVTTIYGATAASHIADPADPARVFSWLICATYDDTGNAAVYDYLPEDGAGVDVALPSERNRTEGSRAANRYLKRIRYGNREPWPTGIAAFRSDQKYRGGWLFETVFDYGDHRDDAPGPRSDRPWTVRPDPFSTYRSGFEVRTYRRCLRVLMFHHFPDEPGVGADCLVASTDLAYVSTGGSDMTTLASVTHTGYRRRGQGYDAASLPPLDLRYNPAVVGTEVRGLSLETLADLPSGIDGTDYQWVDLNGEGLSGILSQQGGPWYYRSNLGGGQFAPPRLLAAQPATAGPGSRQELLDLSGDGRLDLAELGGPMPGCYQRTVTDGWQPFRPFLSRPSISWDDPDLRMVDLDGDGLADVLITGDDAFTWYPSLGLDGFGEGRRACCADPWSEERGPRLMFADPDQTIYLTDMSGDGLSDLVRVRNGEVCYWPNIGFGRFGAKVTMDHSPWMDQPGHFDQRRVRLSDVDGTGCADLIYLHSEGTRLYLNQSGNGYGEPHVLPHSFPRLDSLAHVMVADLLGHGTACLVWSSPLPGDAGRQVRYVNLMTEGKPYLLTGVVNNLGAETVISYAPSTQFYLADQAAGRPWITRLPFPVQVVERTEVIDRVNRNRFTTRHAYHHGYYDGFEREFRGFGMVETWDTQDLAVLETNRGGFANLDHAADLPPVLTRTWLHTGVFPDENWVSRQYAREYWHRPGGADPGLPDTALPGTLRLAGQPARPWRLSRTEAREACRALRGMPLREEVYALDGSPAEDRPYLVTEHNYTIELLQPAITPVPDGPQNYHAVLLTHARESVTAHYERVLNPTDGELRADPRITHDVVLAVDDYGNPLRSASAGYGRRYPDPLLAKENQAVQARLRLTYTANDYTNAVDLPDARRTPMPAQTKTFEVVGLFPVGRLFGFTELRDGLAMVTAELPFQEWDADPAALPAPVRRLIDHTSVRYRRDDLSGALPPGILEPLALPYRSYRQAFTASLVADLYGSQVDAEMLRAAGFLREGETWWLPSGRVFYSPGDNGDPAAELSYARRHFFQPHRFTDPFGNTTAITYDRYDLLVRQTRDPLGNVVTAGERALAGELTADGNDYRVLAPRLISDPNRNRAEVAFDALGMVVGTAVMGKPAPAVVEGDSLTGFATDPTQAEIDQFLANPKGPMAATLLANATTRVVYDLTAYWREPDPAKKPPAVAATLVRETHVSDLHPGQQSKIQVSLSYSDGFGREIQKKIQAESGPAPQRNGSGTIIVGADGQPLMTPMDVSPRWIGSGWTVFNNKGKPVRQYEPFFTDTHRFEFDVKIGVSPVLLYDPVGRVVATLHPDHTWEKVVFDPWRQETWDVNDTVLIADPKADADVGGFFGRFANADYLPTWYALRTDAAYAAAFAAHYPDATDRTNETWAAEKTRVHAATPTVAHADSLGRTFLTVAHNKAKYSDTPSAEPPAEEFPATRVILDIQGNQPEVIDAKDRVVMRHDYDMLGNPVHRASMEAGERWTLNDVAGKPLYAWDRRDRRFRTAYDRLRRPTDSLLRQGGGPEVVVGRSIYGEERPHPEDDNLRGKVVELSDQAGVVTSDRYDFKGNLLESRRRLALEYKTTLDWSGAVPLEPQAYTSRTRYDALNRATQLIAPHSDQPGAEVNVIQPGYNEANLPEQVNVWLNHGAEPGNLLDPATANLHAVTDIDYDARGQRVRIAYGNGARTTYTYDLLTFRLRHLLTRRNAAGFPGDCPEPPPAGWPGCQVQNLHYTYDPVGNITHIRDDAQQTIYFRNKRVDPSAGYTYDAIYRLIEGTGREHLGQAGAPIPYSYNDAPRVGLLQPNDGNAMGHYVELYVYDAVGNLLSMQHRGSDSAHPGWTRAYNYNETSQLEPGKQSNRLTSTTVGATTETYSTGGGGYDRHGNMLRMPHLGAGSPEPNMRWDYRDQLHETDLGGGGRAYYVYDASGQRVRKVWEKSPAFIDERFYLGDFEIFRRRKNLAGVETSMLERETLHVMNDTGRLALVETRTLDRAGDDKAPRRLIRYQFGNHLGSTSVELDDHAQIISYEEYAPYGSSTYQAVRSQTETAKRYRYTGKERDEESGFYYHGARYYVPWLGRWTSADPDGMADGVNLFAYGRNNPLTYSDPTGTTCDPTLQSCIDPTESTAREEALQKSLPENERYLPPPAALSSSNSSSISVGLSLSGNLLSSAASSAPVTAGIPAAAPGTDFAAAAAQARQAYRAANVMPPGTQVQHWTKELSATAANMDPAVMNLNLSPLQSRNALPATTLLVDPNGAGTTYSVAGGSVFGNEHKFADRFFIPQIEDQIRAANPSATAGEVAEAAGRQARWAMTGDPGPAALPPFPGAGMSSSSRWIFGGAGALNVAGGAFMLASINTDVDPGIVTAGKITSGTASVVGGGMEIGGALAGSAGVVEAGAAASGVGLIIAAPIMVYEMRPRGWMAQDPDLVNKAMERYRNGENVNPFCAQCHGPGGALDPNNDWNAGGARRAAFARRLQWVYLGD